MTTTTTLIPSEFMLNDWANRLQPIQSQVTRYEIPNDLGTVLFRIQREVVCRRALESGCAFRILRAGACLRDVGDLETAQLACSLAQDMVSYETNPSPTWEEMCRELGFPVSEEEALSTPARPPYVPTLSLKTYARMGKLDIILIAYTDHRLYYARGLARNEDLLRRLLFPLTSAGEPLEGVGLCFALPMGGLSAVTGYGGITTGQDGLEEHESLLRHYVTCYGHTGLAGVLRK